jgi:hypothetical protein
MSGHVILLLCRVQVLGREKARHIYRRLLLPPPSPTNCHAWVTVVVAEHQVGGDKLACVTLDEQATEFVFGYSRPIHAVELHELPPVSSTTQILPFEVRSREGVLQICTHSSWPVRSLRNICLCICPLQWPLGPGRHLHLVEGFRRVGCAGALHPGL